MTQRVAGCELCELAAPTVVDNDRFAVVPGHEDGAIERVVEENGTYVIVDKRPEAEPYVGADGEPDSGA